MSATAGGEVFQRPATEWWRHWPLPAGVAFAAMVWLTGTGGERLAGVLAAAALVYAGAAAWGRPTAAWWLFLTTALVITLTRFTGAVPDPTWVFVVAGLVLWAAGAVWRIHWPSRHRAVQGAAMAIYGLVAAIGLLAAPTIGAWIIAVGLAAHAAWDLYHYRRRAVVPTSFAEFCFSLDLTLALIIIGALLT